MEVCIGNRNTYYKMYVDVFRYTLLSPPSSNARILS